MSAPAHGGETILIVDDDELVLPSTKSLVERLGYRVLTARNGREALDILRQGTLVDLLFTDLLMPDGMNGPQLVAEARRLRPQLKVLYGSGYLDYSVLRRRLDPGIGRVSKPYWPDELAAKLRDVLSAPAHGGETILIVDDDELVLPSTKRLIESLGYRVLTACNGREALEILRKDTPIDLLFTDLFMPGGLHGPQLVAEARRLRPELKVLYGSGYFNYSVLRQSLDPAIERVSKPYRPEELAGKLREVLETV
jgi:CheY-like chemotaxis protein